MVSNVYSKGFLSFQEKLVHFFRKIGIYCENGVFKLSLKVFFTPRASLETPFYQGIFISQSKLVYFSLENRNHVEK